MELNTKLVSAAVGSRALSVLYFSAFLRLLAVLVHRIHSILCFKEGHHHLQVPTSCLGDWDS